MCYLLFPASAFTPAIEYFEIPELIILEGNSLKAVSNPVFILLTFNVYGILIDKTEIDLDQLRLLKEIIKRESNGDPNICNKEFGCKAGMGLTQLIPGTVKYCEKKLDKKIDPFNPDDNLECAIWLLTNEGIRHWEPYSGPYF